MATCLPLYIMLMLVKANSGARSSHSRGRPLGSESNQKRPQWAPARCPSGDASIQAVRPSCPPPRLQAADELTSSVHSASDAPHRREVVFKPEPLPASLAKENRHMTNTTPGAQTRQVWFLTGSQELYGPQTLAQVAEQSRSISQHLATHGNLQAEIVWKPVLTGASAIRACLDDANREPSCVGVIAWMHTFSPPRCGSAGSSAA